MISLHPVLTLSVAAVLVLGCASARVDPDAAWLRTRTLPAADDAAGLAPLIDCAPDSPERPLCPSIQTRPTDRDDIEATCTSLVSSSETAFVGHRCLAALALYRANHLTVHTQETSAADDPVDFTAQEAQLVEQWASALRVALEHLERAAELEPALVDLHRHRATWAMALLTLTASRASLDATLDAARATLLEADAALAELAPGDPALRDELLAHTRLVALHDEVALASALLEQLAHAAADDVEVATARALFELGHGRLDAVSVHLDRAAALGARDPIVLEARVELALVAADLSGATSAAALVLERVPDTASETTRVLGALDDGGAVVADRALASRVKEALGSAAALGELALEVSDTQPAAGLALALWASRDAPDRLTPVLAASDILRVHYDRPDTAADLWIDLLARLERTGEDAPDASLDQVRMFTAEALIGAGRGEAAAEVLRRVEDPGLRAGEVFERLWQAARQ